MKSSFLSPLLCPALFAMTLMVVNMFGLPASPCLAQEPPPPASKEAEEGDESSVRREEESEEPSEESLAEESREEPPDSNEKNSDDRDADIQALRQEIQRLNTNLEALGARIMDEGGLNQRLQAAEGRELLTREQIQTQIEEALRPLQEENAELRRLLNEWATTASMETLRREMGEGDTALRNDLNSTNEANTQAHRQFNEHQEAIGHRVVDHHPSDELPTSETTENENDRPNHADLLRRMRGTNSETESGSTDEMPAVDPDDLLSRMRE